MRLFEPFLYSKLMTAEATTNVVGRIEWEVLLTLNIGFNRAANIALRQALNVTACKANALAGADDLVTMLEEK